MTEMEEFENLKMCQFENGRMKGWKNEGMEENIFKL